MKRSLWRHKKYECQKEPLFKCVKCSHKTKHKCSIISHIVSCHPEIDINSVKESLNSRLYLSLL